jgi:AcrR family transcriptional regulator
MERDQAILDAAGQLLLRHGYNKLTMGDVADAVDLHRGLVYLRFKSKDDLVAVLVLRELKQYALAWREQLETDPEGGSVGSAGRAMLRALTALPLASAIVARDEAVFGKYLRKPATLFDRPILRSMGTKESFDALREAGVIRADVDTGAAAYLYDALIPAVRSVLRQEDPGQPSWEALLETLSDMLDRTLTPPGGADLAAGKKVLLDGLERTLADFEALHSNHKGSRQDD